MPLLREWKANGLNENSIMFIFFVDFIHSVEKLMFITPRLDKMLNESVGAVLTIKCGYAPSA